MRVPRFHASADLVRLTALLGAHRGIDYSPHDRMGAADLCGPHDRPQRVGPEHEVVSSIRLLQEERIRIRLSGESFVGCCIHSVDGLADRPHPTSQYSPMTRVMGCVNDLGDERGDLLLGIGATRSHPLGELIAEHGAYLVKAGTLRGSTHYGLDACLVCEPSRKPMME